ncbi:hypothetical protein MMC28_004790 [Mycoblastus sanguinarius]|nr:hypothetical protein [Mycoblastus sanguinarius]
MPNALRLTPFLPLKNTTSNSSSATESRLLNLPPLSETIPYLIPDSTITLMMNPRPNIPIPPLDLQTCLFATADRVLDHIQRFGDGPLEDSDNPFESDPFPDTNCKFAVRG